MRAPTESLREAEGKNGVRVVNVALGYVKTNIPGERLEGSAKVLHDLGRDDGGVGEGC